MRRHIRYQFIRGKSPRGFRGWWDYLLGLLGHDHGLARGITGLGYVLLLVATAWGLVAAGKRAPDIDQARI